MLESKLQEFNIFALRDFARKTGVKSPTSKKKEQLVEEIMQILNGEKKPEEMSKQGRPPKVFDYNFSQVFNGQTVEDFSRQVLNQETKEMENVQMVTVAGWLELLENNVAMLWVEKDLRVDKFFVPTSVLKNCQVKMGDRVVAEVSADSSQKVVKEIFSINDNPIMKLPKKREDYSFVEHKPSSRKLKFKNEEFSSLNLMVGQNVYVYGKNNNQNTIKMVELIKDCEIENKLYVNVSLAEKNKIYFKDMKYMENFLANITDEISFSSRIVFLAIERAKRAFENGENVLLIVDDITSILGLEKVGLELVKELVSLAKDGGDKKGTITLVAVMPNEGINQIEKLADERLTVENLILSKI